jgi:hypothetical protein
MANLNELRKRIRSIRQQKGHPGHELDDQTADVVLEIYTALRIQGQMKFYQARVEEFNSNSGFMFTIAALIMAISTFISIVNISEVRPLLAIFMATLPAVATLIASFRQLYQWDRQAALYQDAILGLAEAELAVPDDDLLQRGDALKYLPELVRRAEQAFKNEINQWGQIAEATDLEEDEINNLLRDVSDVLPLEEIEANVRRQEEAQKREEERRASQGLSSQLATVPPSQQTESSVVETTTIEKRETAPPAEVPAAEPITPLPNSAVTRASKREPAAEIQEAVESPDVIQTLETIDEEPEITEAIEQVPVASLPASPDDDGEEATSLPAPEAIEVFDLQDVGSVIEEAERPADLEASVAVVEEVTYAAPILGAEAVAQPEALEVIELDD